MIQLVYYYFNQLSIQHKRGEANMMTYSNKISRAKVIKGQFKSDTAHEIKEIAFDKGIIVRVSLSITDTGYFLSSKHGSLTVDFSLNEIQFTD